ncbi:uncharacterized protein LOC108925355 [Scleropages formosus]|uniref:protein-tyrosine-phosphatase n=1 Tax=Scleropages formosus TaxID=113540 RepID=A0A8C9W269_SCLFO|nr:uncharacterized protein LOC108925355 [Scleropages formosus]
MPPLPLDERIVVIQRPKSLPLRVGSPPTTSQQSHSASLRSEPPPSKPQPLPRHSRPHPSSSSSSSERKRRSPRRRSKGAREDGERGDFHPQHSNGAVILGSGQQKHTHTIDIKFSLGAGGGAREALSGKAHGGSLGRSSSLKGSREKKVSVRVDLGQGDKRGGRAQAKTEEALQQLQNSSQGKKKVPQDTHHPNEQRARPGERIGPAEPGKERDEDPPPQAYPANSSLSSQALREVACAGNKENSKLGPVHQPPKPQCLPRQHASIPVPHASVLNSRHPALAPLSCNSAAPLHQQLGQPHAFRSRELPAPHLLALASSRSSSRGGAFPSPDHTCALGLSHPFNCGCWKPVRSGGGAGRPGGCQGGPGVGRGSMGLKTLGGCLSTSSTTNTSSSNSTVSDCRTGPLRPLGCVLCSGRGGGFESPAAFRKKLVGGCLPCAPLSSSAPLRAFQSCVGGCNPKNSQAGSSTCSYCSSDPIVVTYNPRRGKLGGAGQAGGLRTAGIYSADDDDYSVRSIWPEELAKKMTRSKVEQNQQVVGLGRGPADTCESQKQNGTSPMVLDCRNLLEFTRSQRTDHAGRRRLQQGKMAVLDFIGSSSGRDVGHDSLKRLWTKGGEHYEGDSNGFGDGTLPHCPSTTSPTSQSPASFSPPPSAHTTLTKARDREAEGGHSVPSHPLPTAQSLHLIPNSLGQDQDEEGRKALQHDPGLSLPLSSFLPSSLSEETELSPDVENAPLSPILPFLFLGNERDAQDLELLLRLNIGFVVNVTTHLPLYHLATGLVRYKRLPATDSSKQNLRQYFEEVFEFIEEAHQSGRGVLVHCQAGVSRSATIVIAYLMKHTLMTMTDAYKYVRSRRPVVSPNLNFMGQLLEFERDLNSGVTPRILTPKLSGLETQV